MSERVCKVQSRTAAKGWEDNSQKSPYYNTML